MIRGNIVHGMLIKIGYLREDDQVDFYPDVHLGRLPCCLTNEVRIVVEKIITYENDSDRGEWFNQMIVMAGDTFQKIVFLEPRGEKGKNIRLIS